GFVHQVLSYNRRGEASRTTSYLERVDSYPAADLDELTKFGPIYLTETEYAARLREVTRTYYRFLGASVLQLRGREFWHYHLEHFKAMGHSVNFARLALHVALRAADIVLNPKRTIEGLLERLGRVVARASRPRPPAHAAVGRAAS